jgi:hypothetical protein
MVSNSRALSKLAESEPRDQMTGFNRSTRCCQTRERRLASRARIQLRLPAMVLISPLCASMRNGCASDQFGKVLVE